MPADTALSGPQVGKSKKNKKKKSGAKQKANGGNGSNDREPHPSSEERLDSGLAHNGLNDVNDMTNGALLGDVTHPMTPNPGKDSPQPDTTNQSPPETEGHIVPQDEQLIETECKPNHPEPDDKFEALVRDRDSLRADVVEMRRSLEQIQTRHDKEMETLQEKLGNTQNEKQHAESQFQSLLGKVNTIKSQLGERLKADAEELAQTRVTIEELENQNSSLTAEVDIKSKEILSLQKEGEQKSNELSNLRDRSNLSKQNWLKEREDLMEQQNYLREEFEEAKQAMHNWEIIAMEERSIREGLGEKVVDLKERLANLNSSYEKVTSECATQTVTVEGLQKALQEIQTARRQELRQLVESSDIQLEELRKNLQDTENRVSEANSALEVTEKELKRALPFEKEVKEKNLLIGKLRHEAVTLNDHLTKALRFLKKGKPEDNVDRHLVTNHILHFLSLDRSDPKKFQVLQLIAALLGWTDEQREQAGLARPGTSSSSSLRIPRSSPVHRTPSSPALATDYLTDNSNPRKESLAELWSNFLKQEAKADGRQTEPKNHTPSDTT